MHRIKYFPQEDCYKTIEENRIVNPIPKGEAIIISSNSRLNRTRLERLASDGAKRQKLGNLVNAFSAKKEWFFDDTGGGSLDITIYAINLFKI